MNDVQRAPEESKRIYEDLSKRVKDFQLLRLPGQPQGMHMGTSYLVNDLWREVLQLRKELGYDH